ncbi:hypothetical protein CFELI_10125 [Corynebacterium felinum]|uniref:Uncharacterized protein n=1 Tax=Corynebacterium felinum TaxID=131318 RepID=A0ABU2BCF2_9CORY|nr:hypothetical protein [Corynebacterium felinum]WJY95623.1 hypothetical protein CFELI_10125 [Corynebacterium felinum]
MSQPSAYTTGLNLYATGHAGVAPTLVECGGSPPLVLAMGMSSQFRSTLSRAVSQLYPRVTVVI